jgi:nucleoside 2-deoxyribosyltransferase
MRVHDIVEEEGFRCDLPQEILPPGPSADPIKVLRLNSKLVRSCDVVLSILDSPGEGVFFELGAAYALGKPIVAFRSQTNDHLGKVVEGVWLTLPQSRKATSLDELRFALRRLRRKGESGHE